GPGQQMIIDTGYLAVMDATCTMDIQSVGSMKNAFLGGEGLFNTVVTGPGKIILQTMPISGVAGAISPYIITSK
ncbi:MAG: AIM24 family protein, partial [Firmicutes bacterium]|nr:AIM24 family protein [Bacillota bacterium]